MVCVVVVAHDRWRRLKASQYCDGPDTDTDRHPDLPDSGKGREMPRCFSRSCLFFFALVSRLLAASVTTLFRNWRNGLD